MSTCGPVNTSQPSREVTTAKKARVLIVDDDPMVRDLLYDILEAEGYTVAAVESASAALEMATPGSFDLLLTDIKMPDMSGLELVGRFRQLAPQTVPVLITGYPSGETVAAAMDNEIGDYIIKPIGKAELCTVVANALEKRKPAAVEVKANTIVRGKPGTAHGVVRNLRGKAIAVGIGSGLSVALLLAAGNSAARNTPLLIAILVAAAAISLALAAGLKVVAEHKPQKAAPTTVPCTKCGAQSPKGARFCMRCGSSVP